MGIINDIKITEYFSLYEFDCPCCRRVMLSPDLLARVNHLRMVINKSIYINSGYRCKEENHKVGKNFLHLDIRPGPKHTWKGNK